MIICVKCKKEMVPHINGVWAVYYPSHGYPGDLYRCITCGVEILVTNKGSAIVPKSLPEDLRIQM